LTNADSPRPLPKKKMNGRKIEQETMKQERFHLNERHFGLLASMALHTAFVMLFFIQPAAEINSVKTFNIHFADAGQAEPSQATAFPQRSDHAIRKSIARAPAAAEKTAAAPVLPAREPAVEKQPAPPAGEEIATGKPAVGNLPPASKDPDAFVGGATTDNGNMKSAIAGHDPRVVQNSSPMPGATAGFGRGKGAGDAAGVSGKGAGETASATPGSGLPVETRFGAVDAPTFLHRELPVYPPLAQKRGIEGRIVLTLLIDPEGHVQKIEVTEAAGHGFTEAALEAIRKSTFAPARVNGKKVASRAVLPVHFRLR
jgi:protein TonB